MDSLDAQLIRALKADGRASLRRIAEVLGVSDQQVGRRYAGLRARGVMQVRGRWDPRQIGQSEWVFRLRCMPPATLQVAGALARLEYTRWIRLVSGGAEIVGNIDTRSMRDADALLLEKLPASRRVTSIKAYRVLRRFRGGPDVWPVPYGALTPGQVDRLSPPPVTAEAATAVLRAGDRALLDELARDGRASCALLAALLGRDESTIRRRIHQLRVGRTLYFDVELDESQLGYTSNAILWLAVEPAALESAGRSLSEWPETAYAAASTGEHNLIASVLCTSDESLYDCIANRAGALPGIRSMETSPVARVIKRIGLP